MNENLMAAGIAALVSVVVSAIGFIASSRQLSAHREKHEREIEAKRTDLLYELRLKHYPLFFELTVDLHRENSSFEFFSALRGKIREWRSGEPMLVLSKSALQCLYELEKALSKQPDDRRSGKYSDQQLQKLWRLRLRARGALRRDIGLLFNDPEEANFWRGKSMEDR